MGERVMDDSVKGFVERQNIARYIDLIKTETDPVKRKLLLRLLAAEQTKQIEPSARYPSQVRASGTTG
jgi:hypothetical protein